uniref:Uncharacterized protein n=1 Tax=viral metagenome TaxID=1070528 RepID=A0A6C0KX31_9ZZZZ
MANTANMAADIASNNEITFKDKYVSCKATVDLYNHTVQIEGMIANFAQFSEVKIIAANPPDRMTAYAGSGLPFPCSQFAFENSPNQAFVDPSGSFKTTFLYPNAYYVPDMFTKIAPSVYFVFKPIDKNKEPHATRVELFDNLPVRSLVHRPNHAKGPGFYSAKETLIGIRSAEDTMRTLAQYKGLYDIA